MVTLTQTNENGQQTILLATVQSQSVLLEVTLGEVNRLKYTAYGHLSTDRQISTRLGFNGELREQRTHWHMLGNGYRAYNPVLMRFHSPDKLSPFGTGGLNSYMYCVGDPINHRDPTGRFGIPIILSQLLSFAGGTSSVGGMGLSLTSSGRFSRQGILALGTGATGVLLGAAAAVNPASVIAPILASSSIASGAASLTLAYRAARAATTRSTQWFQDMARVFDRPPRYSTLSLAAPEALPPSFSSLSLPPPYSPPRTRSPIALTHTTARAIPAATERRPRNLHSVRDHEALLNPPVLLKARMSELPKLHYIDETRSVSTKIRSSVS
ncbi:RHS repeat-associated core domain-containing protein [Pseudomonas fluorescens]|uniref:RHS repeat-associated core domain-containing protein n=1 Tax=Pseudomonas fluorescens TaxID=294 RepID=UPI0009B90EEB|nr:RHS repeat-associated core domain-containing protein [Pseudomonas fluorescens]